jgi:hypothetical protein
MLPAHGRRRSFPAMWDSSLLCRIGSPDPRNSLAKVIRHPHRWTCGKLLGVALQFDQEVERVREPIDRSSKRLSRFRLRGENLLDSDKATADRCSQILRFQATIFPIRGATPGAILGTSATGAASYTNGQAINAALSAPCNVTVNDTYSLIYFTHVEAANHLSFCGAVGL